MLKKIFYLSLFIPTFAFAQTASWINSKKAIKSLEDSLSHLSHHTELNIIFPKKIWVSKKQLPYYLYIESSSKYQYKISVDTSSNCHGAHYCSIGSLMAFKDGSIQMLTSKEGEKITTPLLLNHRKKVWFTPSHAMGSYWPAQIEWREKSILYRLTWNVDRPYSESSVLIDMILNIKHFTH